MKIESILRGIINGCVHPEKAARAVMIDLTPIREVLKKCDGVKKNFKKDVDKVSEVC